ncbi:hypothetical protein [Kribbella pratensis]|uniref:hypothetical protein n=1 Tax=Kribbella pratensis TaxID=2512112 RepID=UPI001064E4E3|nr:hypothetical protein [Kribbella pratensis]
MQYVPFSVIKSIHEQTHSAMPSAPIRPYVPKRHPIRDAVRRWRERRTPAPQAVELTLIASPAVACEAEVRDRGTTPAGVARAG